LQRAAKPFAGSFPGIAVLVSASVAGNVGATTRLSKLAASSSPEWMKWDVIEARVFAVSPERIPSNRASWSVTVAAGHPGIDE
jgi:hypothetical protein